MRVRGMKEALDFIPGICFFSPKLLFRTKAVPEKSAFSCFRLNQQLPDKPLFDEINQRGRKLYVYLKTVFLWT